MTIAERRFFTIQKDLSHIIESDFWCLPISECRFSFKRGACNQKYLRTLILNVIRTFGNNTPNVFSKFYFVPIPKATSSNKFAVNGSKTAVPNKVKT